MATSDNLVLLLIALTIIVLVPLLRVRGARGGRLVP
jgi:hypothetical protein